MFPIELYDSNNAIVASTYAIADLAPEGNRVTTFHASIDSLISQPTTRLGRVVFYKYKLRDNPANGEIASIGVDFGKLYGGVITYKNGGAVTTLKTPTKKSNAYTFGTNNSSSTQTSTSTTTTQSTSSNTSQKTVVINGIVFPAHGTLDPKYADYAEESGPDTCNDGYDNDSDKRTDSADPNCHTDGKANNIRTYIGSRDENPDDPEPPIPANPTA